MAVTVDSLQLEIQASSEEAKSGLEALEATLTKLKTATKGGFGLSTVAKQVEKLSQAVKSVGVVEVTNLNGLVQALKGLEGLKDVKLSSTIATSITGIANASKELSAENVVLIRSLVPALASLSAINDIKISSSISRGITEIGTAAKSLAGVNLAPIRDVASAISSLAGISGIKVSSTIGKQLLEIAAGADAMRGVDFTPITQLASSLQPLANLSGLSLRALVNGLKEIPAIATQINAVDFTQFRSNIDSIVASLMPLANVMNNVGNAFRRFPSQVQRVARSANSISREVGGATFSFAVFTTALRNSIDAAKRVAGVIKGFISNYNDYIENMNLFTVSMGKYADQARQYAEHVGEVMGIDPSQWMRNQGVFMTLAEGFGVVSDRAYIMSKNLTQLGYDISSFFNIPIEESMEKLTSGISGEIEPLRRLGFDLSQARLRAIAASLGIKQTVSSMTQAEKAQLRYYAIMTQVTTAQGDMARTLTAPANQLRILSASVTQAGRAIGQIFVPILNAVLPVAIAVAKAVRAIAVAIASLFGYDLPEVDFSVTVDSLGGVSSGMDDIASGAGNAGSAAKKLKSILMGFDEINQLPDPTSSGGGGGGGAGGGGGSMSGLDFELPEYDFLSGLVGSSVDAIYAKMKPAINWITDNLDTVLTLVKGISTALLMWKVASAFLPDLGTGWDLMSKIAAAAALLSVLTISVTLVYSADKNFIKTGNYANLVSDGLATLVSALLSDRILVSKFGAKAGVGGGIALTISAMTSLKAMYDGVVAEGLGWKTALVGIVGAAKSAIAGGLLASVMGLSVAGGVITGLVVTVAVAAGLVFSGIKKNNISGTIEWGDVQFTAGEIQKTIDGMFGFDTNATITLLENKITNEEEARNALNSAVTEFNASILPFEFNLPAGEAEVQALMLKAQGLVDAFKAQMEAQNELVNLAVTLVPHTNANGEDGTADLISAMNISETTLSSYMATLGGQLADALNAGLESGAFDQELITDLTGKMAEVSRAITTGVAQGEASARVGNLLSNLSEDSFKGTIEQFSTIVDGLESKLIEAEIAAKGSLQGRLAGLQTMQSQLLSSGDITGAQELQAQIDSISATLENWDISKNVSDAINNMTGPMRQEWATALQSVFGTNLGGLVDFSPFIAFNLGTAATWDTDTLTSEFNSAIEESIKLAIGEENAQYYFDIAESLGVTGFDLLSEDVQQQLYDTLVNAVGQSRADEVFANLGLTIGGVSTQLGEVASAATTAGAEITNATTNMQTGTTNLEAAFGDVENTAKKDLPKVESEFSAIDSAILATGSNAETLNTKIVEIPTEKTIAIEIDGYSLLISRLKIIKNKIDGIASDLSISLKVKAGLTPSAKSFLTELKNMDPLSAASVKIANLIKLSAYAQGGFPRSGELFIANENGRQEMVGRIGNRSAVANQDQIGEAIFRYMDAHDAENGGGINEDRLAGAIAGALKAAGIGMVSLDGRMLAQSINRESQRSGRPAINF